MIQNNIYKDDFMQASEYLRLVLPFLSKYQIPASPINYLIGYEYISAGNVALKKAIDNIIDQSSSITEKKLLEIYQQYISRDDTNAINTVRMKLQSIMNTLQDEYLISSQELNQYLSSLSHYVEILSTPLEKNQLDDETRKVVVDTQSTETSQRNLDNKLSSMMDEVQLLRQQLEQVREESLTDALTGLANRRAFDGMLEKLLQQNSEEDIPFCLVIADIDYFKKFNDTYGHLVGDKVLRYVGKTIKSCVKGMDMTARFGGEEFVILLPETEMEGAEIVAEHVRQAISKKDLTDHSKNSNYGRITISLGISQYQKGELPTDLISRADQALYKAKENGRNRVEQSV